MRYLIFILLFPLFSSAQNADWQELQGRIDEAVKTNGTVQINRNYTIDKPLVIANWNGTDYGQVCIRFIGHAMMGDNGQVSRIHATFKDAPIISIQKGKGSVIRGVSITGSYSVPRLSIPQLYKTDFDTYGDPSCRDSRYSPYAGIAIDPFMYTLPPDSGYPSLRTYYRGSTSKGGSTAIRIEDVNISNVTIGIILSPNGYTLNNELIKINNIQFANCKAGFVGCQAQEKMNTITNVMAWGTTHTIFVWNKYGQRHPGQYIIDGVNVAGSVVKVVHRHSGGWYALKIKNLFAESIGSIGEWSTGIGATAQPDALEDASVDFRPPSETGYLPDFAFSSTGVDIRGSSLRYMGEKIPLLMPFVELGAGNNFNVPPIVKNYGWEMIIKQPFFEVENTPVINHTATISYRHPVFVGTAKAGDHVLFMTKPDWKMQGQGIVQKVDSMNITIGYISPSIQELKNYRIGILK